MMTKTSSLCLTTLSLWTAFAIILHSCVHSSSQQKISQSARAQASPLNSLDYYNYIDTNSIASNVSYYSYDDDESAIRSVASAPFNVSEAPSKTPTFIAAHNLTQQAAQSATTAPPLTASLSTQLSIKRKKRHLTTSKRKPAAKKKQAKKTKPKSKLKAKAKAKAKPKSKSKLKSKSKAKPKQKKTSASKAAPKSGNLMKECLDAHNKYRQQHKSPPLAVKPELVKLAQSRADEMKRTNRFEHKDNFKYGENLHSRKNANHANCAEVVQSWHGEVKQYNFDVPELLPSVLHFTQLVWKDTKFVGCAQAYSDSSKRLYTVCNYDPEGNVVGEEAANILKK